ncbi:hypothetical protein B0O99DRAFT_669332 [Bisporella sp. PMI_857]|nr:hypothetical protein B0O99DRAFT_669332 [Bisporella sp. PMI_857]
MALVHIVLFKFKSSLSSDVIKAACARMLALKESCIHPTSQEPYILESSGGKDNSPEGLQDGLSHGFVVKFASERDRDYYVKEDPVHQTFVKSLDGLIEKVTVVDYEQGNF